MVGVLTSGLNYLEGLGFYEIVLPFIFVFTIIFAILQKVKIFRTKEGKAKKNINVVLAFVFAAMFIASISSVNILNTSLEQLGLALVVITMGLMLTGFLGYKDLGNNKWIPLAAIVVIVIIFGTSFGLFLDQEFGLIVDWLSDPVVWAVIVFILVTWYLTSGGSKTTEEAPSGRGGRPSAPRGRRHVQRIPGSEITGQPGSIFRREPRS